MNKYILFACSFIIMSTQMYSQAMYVDDSNDYVIVQGNYENESGQGGTSSYLNLGGSYIFDGKFKLGLEYLSGAYKSDAGSIYDQDISGFAFDLAYHIKNPEGISIAFEGAYMSMSFDADYLDNLGWTLSGNGTGIGVYVYKSVVERENFKLIPFAGFRSTSVTAKIEDSFGDSIEDDETSTSMHFGVGIKSNNFFLEPTITRSDGESDFLVRVGIIIPQ